jgi:hypothetical protein
VTWILKRLPILISNHIGSCSTNWNQSFQNWKSLCLRRGGPQHSQTQPSITIEVDFFVKASAYWLATKNWWLMWYVYVLYSCTGKRSYVGYSNDDCLSTMWVRSFWRLAGVAWNSRSSWRIMYQVPVNHKHEPNKSIIRLINCKNLSRLATIIGSCAKSAGKMNWPYPILCPP